MPSPVGHTLAGVVIYHLVRTRWPNASSQTGSKAFLPFLLLPNLPDLDLLLGYLRYNDPLSLHGGLIHTPSFAILVSLLIAPFQLCGKPVRTFLVTASLLASHLLLDFASGPHLGSSSGRGIMLFYPISVAHLHSPVSLFLGPTFQPLHNLLSLNNLLAISWELLIFLPLMLYLFRK